MATPPRLKFHSRLTQPDITIWERWVEFFLGYAEQVKPVMFHFLEGLVLQICCSREVLPGVQKQHFAWRGSHIPDTGEAGDLIPTNPPSYSKKYCFPRDAEFKIGMQSLNIFIESDANILR